MPLIFIHGVNTRFDKNYTAAEELRRKLFTELVLSKIDAISNLEIISPYWGDLAGAMAWNGATRPTSQELREKLGGGDSGETLPVDVSELTDPECVVDSVLFGLLQSGFDGRSDSENDFTLDEDLDASIVLAAHRASSSDRLRDALTKISSEDLMVHYEKSLQAATNEITLQLEVLSKEKEPGPMRESLGGGGNILTKAIGRVKEFASRAVSTTGRFATGLALDWKREQIQRTSVRFMGDVFTYLKERGSAQMPGDIVSRILPAFNKRDEPIVVISHSMGGNIFYDLLTYFDPSLSVDAWFSVGGQVGLFEEMKLFKVSDKNIKAPHRVKIPSDRLSLWMNVVDLRDPLAFLAKPIFESVEDYEFNTGRSVLGAHSAYFSKPKFYDRICLRLKDHFK